jgi:hypothetical protein
MNKQFNKSEAVDEIEAIAERAERGEDVSAHFTNRHVAKQRINIDFPLLILCPIRDSSINDRPQLGGFVEYTNREAA